MGRAGPDSAIATSYPGQSPQGDDDDKKENRCFVDKIRGFHELSETPINGEDVYVLLSLLCTDVH